MNNPTMTGGEAKHTRRLFIFGILLIVAAIAITAGRLIHSRMQQARLVQDRPNDLQYGVRVYSLATAATAGNTGNRRDEYLAKANLLRDHWRVWAVAHQGLLQQLRHASPSDQATLIRVYSALPTTADSSAGVTSSEVSFNEDDFKAGRGTLFTWQAGMFKMRVSEASSRNDPQALEKNERSNTAYRKKLQRDFAAYHGIMLSESVAAGGSQITLWTDGRVTEMTRQRQHIIGKPIYIDGPEKQIVPAYDLLK